MTIGTKLKSRLQNRDMSVTELAERLGYSRQYVSYLVNDRRKPSTETALRLSVLFGTSIYFWLNEDVLL